jgi:predicted nucleic acid-binding protein
VLIPSVVYDEVVTEGVLRGYPDAVVVQRDVVDYAMRVVSVSEADLHADVRKAALGTGERHTMGLALREGVRVVLLDDLAAREHAAKLGLSVRGTLGIVAAACRGALLNASERDAAFQTMLDRADIWLNERLIRGLWQELRDEQSRLQ